MNFSACQSLARAAAKAAVETRAEPADHSTVSSVLSSSSSASQAIVYQLLLAVGISSSEVMERVLAWAKANRRAWAACMLAWAMKRSSGYTRAVVAAALCIAASPPHVHELLAQRVVELTGWDPTALAPPSCASQASYLSSSGSSAATSRHSADESTATPAAATPVMAHTAVPSLHLAPAAGASSPHDYLTMMHARRCASQGQGTSPQEGHQSPGERASSPVSTPYLNRSEVLLVGMKSFPGTHDASGVLPGYASPAGTPGDYADFVTPAPWQTVCMAKPTPPSRLPVPNPRVARTLAPHTPPRVVRHGPLSPAQENVPPLQAPHTASKALRRPGQVRKDIRSLGEGLPPWVSPRRARVVSTVR